MPVSAEDYTSISDFLGRYCWLVDAGDEDGWAALWTENGIFAGVGPEPIVGREALKAVPRGVVAGLNGTARHHAASLCCDYEGDSRDVVIARYYNLVTNWVNGGAFSANADCTVRLVRNRDSWLLSRSDTVMLA